MSTRYAPLYEGDSLIHDAPERLAPPSAQVFERIFDRLLALFRRLEHAWVAGIQRDRERQIEALLADSQDLHEVERRLAVLQRSGLI
jgi:hypothetical protein